jgi:hypothetical protein
MSEKTRRPPLRTDRNQCPTCSALFNSVAAFDKHRVAERKGTPYPRRCLDTSEMTARGMSVSRSGFWVTEAHPLRRRTAS